MATQAAQEAREYGRAASLLTIALATAGALTYVFFAVASHSLSEDEYGRIVVLWSVVFISVSVLFRPVEQLLARTVADLSERGHSVRHACRVAATIQMAVAVVFLVVALALRSVLTDELFDGKDLLFWVLVGSVLAFAASYFARGFFAGSHRMGWYAALLIVEGVVRLSLAFVVAVGISEGAGLVAIGIAAGPLASLAVVPLALRRTNRTDGSPVDVSTTPPRPSADAASPFTLAQGGGFAAALLCVMLSEQVLLNSGVLFVRGAEGAAAAGFIFNVLMVARAPVVLFQAVAASLLPHLTRLRSRGDRSSGEAFALSVNLTLLVVAGFTAVVLLGVLAVGPPVMQIAFGDNFDYDRVGLSIVAVGMGCYLAAATFSQATIAQGKATAAAACWLASGAAFIAINLTSVSDAFRRVEAGFAASALLLLVGLFLVYRSRARGAALEPGSSRELEAQLAAADEAV